MGATIFSEWIQWKNLDFKSKDLTFPGVYILAKFNSVPSGVAKPLDKRIIYVGETCKNTLKGRLYQFKLSAFKGKLAHSGGKSYREQFSDRGKNLYVAVCPVKDAKGIFHVANKEYLRELFIRYVERKIIYDYAQKYKLGPVLNKK